MVTLFERGPLRGYLAARIATATDVLDRLTEDEVLARSIDDVVCELVSITQVEPLQIGDEPVDGGVANGSVQIRDPFYEGRLVNRPVLHLHADYEVSGEMDLLHYQPQQHLAFTTISADLGPGMLTVRATVSAGGGTDADAARRALEDEIDQIRRNAGFAAVDVRAFNNGLEALLRPAVERRKALLQEKRKLAGALGFPLRKRNDAPAQVPLRRKVIGIKRSAPGTGRGRYNDEPALSDAQYEDAIDVVASTLLAMERTPSVASGKGEEELRDQILVQLNGTFEGAATGETFVQTGKTDILIRVQDRHVFVGECKWWSGEKACGNALDQLLSYLPWRDEKAALILFVDRKDASAVLGKAETAVRSHPSFKRAGTSTKDPTKRRNFVISHPDDGEREIHVAVLFAILPRGE